VKFSQDFEIAVPLDQVWRLFQDVPVVVECLPGATLSEDLGGDRYRGDVSVKLGPVSARFEGEAAHAPDEANRSGRIQGKGTDKKGGSRTQATIDYHLEDSPSGTRVTVDSDIMLSGRVAQFGRPGLVREMTGRIIQEFGANLERKLTEGAAPEAVDDAPPLSSTTSSSAAPPVRGFSLLIASLWSLLKGLFRGEKG
jgi:carbon monoxide dehydrogenase subunit G